MLKLRNATLALLVGLTVAVGATSCRPPAPCRPTSAPVGGDYRHGTWYDASGHAVAWAPTEDSTPCRLEVGR